MCIPLILRTAHTRFQNPASAPETEYFCIALWFHGTHLMKNKKRIFDLYCPSTCHFAPRDRGNIAIFKKAPGPYHLTVPMKFAMAITFFHSPPLLGGGGGVGCGVLCITSPSVPALAHCSQVPIIMSGMLYEDLPVFHNPHTLAR